MPGHDSGHDLPPLGLSWDAYITRWTETCGGYTQLADELLRRGAGAVELPEDFTSVEKGLRRLSRRGHKPGGQYGRWMLRFFGMPQPVADWVRWMGQYHTRFADLPALLRLEELRLWDRPPVAESSLAVWIHVGLASVYLRLGDETSSLHWLARAEREAHGKAADAAAAIEVGLLAARIDTDSGHREQAQIRLAQAAEQLSHPDLSRTDALCYHARLAGQRAFHLTKPLPGETADHAAALALFESIEEDPALPFVSFRKEAGRAYCIWKLGDPVRGAQLARLAAEHAGDGGLVRFRVMALNMLSRMVDAEEGARLRERAARMAKQLDDEDLITRVTRASHYRGRHPSPEGGGSGAT